MKFIDEMKWQDLWKEEYRNKMKQIESAEEATMGTHAIIILTEWDCFKELNYQKVFQTMERPAYIFDGRNLLD